MRKILIDARLRDGEAGGIQQILVGLAQGFSIVETTYTFCHFIAYFTGYFVSVRPTPSVDIGSGE
jgi:hypothetical protein